jgi:hypothetical protein
MSLLNLIAKISAILFLAVFGIGSAYEAYCRQKWRRRR